MFFFVFWIPLSLFLRLICRAMPLLTRAMPLFGTRPMPPCKPSGPRGKRQPLTSMWLTNTLLIQNMAGDKCTQEAKPGLDGTGRHWTGPWATGQGSVVGGKKAGNGTYASPHSQYASNLVGFRLKRCQGQIGFHVLAPAVVLIIIIIIVFPKC